MYPFAHGSPMPMRRTAINTATLLLDFRLALRNILRQGRRSGIALMAILFGVIAMMLSTGYIEWINWASREISTIPQIGHAQISMPGYQDDGHADPYAYLLPERATAWQRIETLPGVKSVAPRLNFHGLVSHGENTLSFIGEGIDPDKDPSRDNVVVVEGQLLARDDPKGIVMGAGLAANLGVKTGDSVVLLANTVSGGINAVEGHVRGLVSTYMKAFDDSTLRIDIELAHELLRTSSAHVWVVSLEETRATDRLLAQLRTDAELRTFDISAWTQLADFYMKTEALFMRQINVVKLIIAVIIVLSISNTMIMSVMERTVEIGTAMALGLRRARIQRLFLIEGGLLGVIGGLIGVILGYLAAIAISAIGIPMPPAPGMSRGFVAGINITPGIAMDALILAVSTTLLASLYPSWRASRLVIVDALRHNR